MPPTNYIWMRTNLKKELVGVYEWYDGKWRLIKIHPSGDESYTYSKTEIDLLLQYTEQEILRKIAEGEYITCDITVDDFLSEESENPVQNKVITRELNKKLNKTDNIPIDELPWNI